MLAPGVPTAVAHDIVQYLGDPDKMAKDVVDTTMDTNYGTRRDGFAPAAAFHVIDLDPKKTAAVATAVSTDYPYANGGPTSPKLWLAPARATAVATAVARCRPQAVRRQSAF